MRTYGSLIGLFAAIAAVLLVPCANAETPACQNATLVLDHGWQFRQVAAAQDAEAGWLPATVPGDVHLDLLANKKIPDPFYRDNESKLQWIQDASWEYRVDFDVTPATARALPCGSRLRRTRRNRDRSI